VRGDRKPIHGGPFVARFVTETNGATLPLDRAALQDLVEIAFAASLEPEEGRYPTPLLYVPDPRAVHDRSGTLSIRFAEPLQLTPERVRRLARVVPQRPHALFVAPRGGDLVCIGTGIVERLRLQSFRPSVGLYLAVQGPGRLTLSGPSHPIVEWRGDVVRRVHDVSHAALFREVCRTALELRSRELGLGVDVLEQAMLDEEYQTVLGVALGAVIAGIRDAGRGGCVVVLPRDANDVPSLVRLGYETRGPELARRLTRRLSEAQGRSVPEPAVVRKDLHDALALARMGSVDGCLVFDARLLCRGFGGKIHGVQLPPCRAVDAPLGAATELVERAATWDLASRGTRHQSAATLCVRHPGTVAIVISQDGEISAMASPDGRLVHVANPLGTYVGWSGTIDSA